MPSLRFAHHGLLVLLVGASGCILDAKRPPPGSNPGRRWAFGLDIDRKGNIRLATGENYRKEYERRFSALISQTLNAGWRAETTIVPNARYVPPDTDDIDDDGWFWNFAAVTVALVGDGSSPRPTVDGQSEPATIKRLLVDFVVDVMRRKMDRRAPLSVDVVARIERARAEGQPPAVEAIAGFAPGEVSRPETETEPPDGPVPPTTVGADVRSQLPEVSGRMHEYTLQEGDTLATISIAFYGSANYWRHILAANPELDPAALEVGTVIKVPAEPRE